jgi:hypothetical protein
MSRRGNHAQPVDQENPVENNHLWLARPIKNPKKSAPLAQVVRGDNMPKANPLIHDHVTSATA